MNNTIEKNGNWISSKIGLENTPTGGPEFFVSPQALSTEKLQLAAVHGFEELIYKEEDSFQEVSFDFLLDKDSYIYFIFNKDNSGFSAIRLSNNQLFPNTYIESYANNQFTKNEKLNLNLNDGWNKLKINFNKNSIDLFLNKNKEKITIDNIELKDSFKVGFKSSLAKQTIDNFYVSSNNKKFTDKFKPKVNLFPNVFSYFAIISLINIIFSFITNNENKTTKLILVNTSLLFILICLFSLAKNQLPAIVSKTQNLISTKSFIPANQEKNVLDSNHQLKEIVEKIDQQVMSKELDQNKKTLIIIGTSQTWGQGSSKLEFSFAKILENMINSSNDQWQVINAGIPGADSTILLDLYQNHWLSLNPKLVIINLSYNDFDENFFEKNLKKFATINKDKNIKTVFVIEANSIELSQLDNKDYTNRQQAMKKAAIDENIPIIDMQNHLNQLSDNGILWWDVIHPTDYGHTLIAKKIYNFLTTKQLLNEKTEITE